MITNSNINVQIKQQTLNVTLREQTINVKSEKIMQVDHYNEYLISRDNGNIIRKGSDGGVYAATEFASCQW